MRVCSKCNLELDESCFRKRHKDKPTLTSWCTTCHREYDKIKYHANVEQSRLKRRKQASKHKDSRRIYRKRYKQLHQDSIKDYLQKYSKQYYQNNKDRLKKANQRWRLINIESRKQYSQQYYKKNKQRIKGYTAYKLKTDLRWRLAKNLRCRLGTAIKNQAKGGSAVRDLGMSIPEFKLYIEARFNEGMTWENWGKVWHLDHIKPLASFDLTDREQFLIAANWANYQPLLVLENLSKGSKYTII